MRYLITSGGMKAVDRYTMEEIGIPSMVLMERAALKVTEEVIKRAKKTDRIFSLCGSGNNGADGIAAARMLFLKGYSTVILLAGRRDKGSIEFLAQLSIAEKLGIEIKEGPKLYEGNCDILIDAMFGVGLDREIISPYREIIEAVKNDVPRLIVAVDIPSGIHGDSGQVMGIALKADVTVTFGWEKLGTMLYPGKEYASQVVVADIGFPQTALEQAKPKHFTLEPGDEALVPKRPAYSNKGTFGRVLIVAGAVNMSGASYLSALSAYRMGAGLVKIVTVEENREILQSQLAEAILITYSTDAAGRGSEEFEALLKEQCSWADVIVLGPGMGREPYVNQVVRLVLTNAYVPIILDADGLNAVAKEPELTGYFTENIIITPHLGEMSRLTGSTVDNIRNHLETTAREYADRFGITCVLKDAVTVAALKDGRTYVNSSGNCAMAKAGAGDVLTGIIAGLLAMGLEESLAAALGIWLHGRAGDSAREKHGDYSLLARELAEELTTILGGTAREQR